MWQSCRRDEHGSNITDVSEKRLKLGRRVGKRLRKDVVGAGGRVQLQTVSRLGDWPASY
jgi:hypothetical protein